MDRHKSNIAKAQTGFLDFLVMPMYQVWCDFLALPEDRIPCMKELNANK